MTSKSKKADEGPRWFRQLVMENYADGKKPPTDGSETAGPDVVEFYQIILEELNKELQAIDDRIKQIERIAPGSSKHVKLMQLYLDKLDEKIEKGLEAHSEIGARSIKTLQENNKMRDQFIEGLEKSNRILRSRITLLENTNEMLLKIITRDKPAAVEKPATGTK